MLAIIVTVIIIFLTMMMMVVMVLSRKSTGLGGGERVLPYHPVALGKSVTHSEPQACLDSGAGL